MYEKKVTMLQYNIIQQPAPLYSSWLFTFGIPSVDMAVDHRVVIFHNVYTVEHINGKHKSSDPRDWVKLLLFFITMYYNIIMPVHLTIFFII